MKNKNLINSFKYAFQGIGTVIKKERNMKIHITMMILVIISGIIFKISTMEWFTCIILFALVIGSEMINTAIETVVDLVMPNINDKAKITKDSAAGAVLVQAIAASIIGLIIFIPKFIALFK